MAIRLITFGGLHAIGDTGELDALVAQQSRAALFVYLALERRVSRESLTTVFWPESDAEHARHSLRQSLYQLRKLVGSEWIESRAHELVVTGDICVDALDFTDAIERGDHAAAAELYRGPFLNGVHLVDLSPWETWGDARRAQYARMFRKACRDLIDTRRTAGDHKGAIETAERWVERDPSDAEAQHRLIEALADAGERVEATAVRLPRLMVVAVGGGQLQIAGAVYLAGGGCGLRSDRVNTVAECPSPEPLASAVVNGTADSVFALVDGLAARLLATLGDAAAVRLARTASLTTASLPAFKAYLQGEALMPTVSSSGRLTRTSRRSRRTRRSPSRTIGSRWHASGLRFPARTRRRTRRHVTARGSPHATATSSKRFVSGARATRSAQSAYRSILTRYPDDVDAWFQLGEILFHHGPLLGRPIGDSEDAWRRVLLFEPRNLFALTHVARSAVVGGRLGALDSLLAPFAPEELRTDWRLAELVLLRAVARGDTAAAHAVARDVRRWEPFAVWRVAVFMTAFTPDPAIMRAVIADLIEDFMSPAQRADLHWFTSLLDLAGGRVDAAEAALARAADAERRPAFQTELGIGAPVQLEPVRQYTLGILSVRLHDSASAAAAATALQQIAASAGATTLTRDLGRGLRARIAHDAGRSAEALSLLETLESSDSQGDVAAIPFVSRANERFLRGEVLAALGPHPDALRWFASLGHGSVTEAPLRAMSSARQTALRERPGLRE